LKNISQNNEFLGSDLILKTKELETGKIQSIANENLK